MFGVNVLVNVDKSELVVTLERLKIFLNNSHKVVIKLNINLSKKYEVFLKRNTEEILKIMKCMKKY